MDAEAVRATLEDRKTQLRVPVKGDLEGTEGAAWLSRDGGISFAPCRDELCRGLMDQIGPEIRSPLGKPGDRLWVRETWQLLDPHQDGDLAVVGVDRFANGRRAPWVGVTNNRPIEWTTVYRADGDLEHPEFGAACWRSPILMPKWASRITLEVAEVRLQRLQQITEDDAIAEGARHWPDIPDPHPYGIGARWSMSTPTSTRQCYGSARFAFASAWNRRHGKRCPWDDNRPVWVYTFRRSP